MGYFKDSFNLMLLKEKTYKKVANDRKSFKRFILAYMTSFYLTFLFIGVLITTFISLAMPFDFNIHYIWIILPVFIITPLILIFLGMIPMVISHWIGLLLGGKPKSFIDFYKVSLYNYPVIMPIYMLFSKIASPIYTIWYLFILYKTYKVVHKLKPKQAGWAIGINIFLYLGFISLCFIIFTFLVIQNPELMAALE